MNLLDEVRKLRERLDDAIKNNLKDIKDAQAELDLIMQMTEKYGHQEFFQSVAKDALEDARMIINEGEKLMKARRLLGKVK